MTHGPRLRNSPGIWARWLSSSSLRACSGRRRQDHKARATRACRPNNNNTDGGPHMQATIRVGATTALGLLFLFIAPHVSAGPADYVFTPRVEEGEREIDFK